MKENHLIVNRTARFYTLGQLSSKTKYVWIVIHGFGQMGDTFLKNFEPLQSEEHFFIAPEALNKFYLKGPGGNVGATWMTKADRLNEIKDYTEYLNDLYELFEFEKQGDLKVIVLGFSQGASTATRWVHATEHLIHHLIVYAGEVAPELIPLQAHSGLKKTKNHFIYGTKDEFFPIDLLRTMRDKYAELNLNVVEFDGGHDIKPALLQDLIPTL